MKDPRLLWKSVTISEIFKFQFSQDSSVGIAMGYVIEVRGSILGSTNHFFLLYSIQTGSGAHPGSYPMGTGSSIPGAKAVGEWSSPLTSI
jgi:hypothetical protein